MCHWLLNSVLSVGQQHRGMLACADACMQTCLHCVCVCVCVCMMCSSSSRSRAVSFENSHKKNRNTTASGRSEQSSNTINTKVVAVGNLEGMSRSAARVPALAPPVVAAPLLILLLVLLVFQHTSQHQRSSEVYVCVCVGGGGM